MRTVKELRDTIPQVGRVEWIGTSAGHRSPIETPDEVVLEAGRGIRTDYHAKSGQSPRQVTLIQAEHLSVLAQWTETPNFSPALLRRNLVVAGINVAALQRQRFRCGSALLEGTGPCPPCSRMEENLGRGGYAAMIGHGGITARVLEGGVVRLGDPVIFVVTPTEPPSAPEDDGTPS